MEPALASAKRGKTHDYHLWLVAKVVHLLLSSRDKKSSGWAPTRPYLLFIYFVFFSEKRELTLVGEMVQNSQIPYSFTFNDFILIHEYIIHIQQLSCNWTYAQIHIQTT